jgi:predicted DNA-binding helix-hairpin-helix protein
MVIGATPASDDEILAKASSLYRTQALRRVYYSAFSPIPHADAQLPVKPAPLIREHRLYQADWLMRHYGFGASELTTPTDPNLSLHADPKLTWALRHREFFPVDVNAASREALLRVPGLGARAVERILRIRRFHLITAADLANLHIPMRRTQNFLITSDTRPRHLDEQGLPGRILPNPEQLPLFSASREALSGEF